MRDAGSSYAWIRVAFGAEAGAYGAWVLLVANIFAVLATALPAGTYTLDLVAPALADERTRRRAGRLRLDRRRPRWCCGTGLRPTAVLALALLVAEVVVLAAAAVASPRAHPRPDAVAFAPAPLAWGGLVGAVVLGIWMIDGWEVCASTAEEAEGAAVGAGLGRPGWGSRSPSVVLLGAIAAFSRIGSAAGFAAHESDALAYVGELLGGGWRLPSDRYRPGLAGRVAADDAGLPYAQHLRDGP